MTRRILHLTHSWGPGGAETVYADLVAGLDPSRFDSVAGLPRPNGWLYDEVCRRGSEPVLFPSRGSFDIRHVAQLVRVIKARSVDLVQAHTFGTSVYASVAGRIARVPVVCTLHGRVDLAIEDRRRAIKWALVRLGATRIVCVSDGMRRELLQTTPGIRPGRAAVIYNGVDVSRYRPGRDARRRQELGIGADEVLIGAVGNVRRVKGYEVLLEAAAILAERGLRSRIVVVGQNDNTVYGELRARAAELGLDDQRVRFLGFRDDIPELFRALDIYVITSHSEGFPLSTIQAMASGLPVVATRCGGPEEMLTEGVNGLLADRGSAPGVASALAALVADEELRRSMGASARRTAVERFSTAAMIDAYQELYDSVLRPPSALRAAGSLEPVQPLEHAGRQ